MSTRQSHTKRTSPARVAACGFLLLSVSIMAEAKEQQACRDHGPLVFGMLPFISAEQLVMRFSPLVNYLSERLRVPVRIETAPNFSEFARRTHQDRHYDILFTAPHFQVPAQQKAGYKLIASVDSPGMWAVIVTPVDSDIHSVGDLKGKRLATVHPMGLATLLVREHLLDAGIDPDVDLVQVVTPSHDASLLSSYHGVTDASALMQPPYEAASEEVRKSMRVIARTRSAPHIPISVGRWVPDDCAVAISALLLGMANTPEGKAALSHNSFSGFKKGDPEVYEELNKTLFQ